MIFSWKVNICRWKQQLTKKKEKKKKKKKEAETRIAANAGPNRTYIQWESMLDYSSKCSRSFILISQIDLLMKCIESCCCEPDASGCSWAIDFTSMKFKLYRFKSASPSSWSCLCIVWPYCLEWVYFKLTLMNMAFVFLIPNSLIRFLLSVIYWASGKVGKCTHIAHK